LRRDGGWSRGFFDGLACEGTGLRQPALTLFDRARGDDPEEGSDDVLHSAEAQDAIPPDLLQWVSKYISFPFNRGVAGIYHESDLGLEQTYGYIALIIAFLKGKSSVWRKNAVNPALCDRRRRTPAIRVDHRKKLALSQLRNMLLNQRISRSPASGFIGRQERREAFLQQIMKRHVAAAGFPRAHDRSGNGMIQAPGSRVAYDDKSFHLSYRR